MRPGEQTAIGPRLDDSIALVDRTVETVRDVATALRPLILDHYGLLVALRSYAKEFAARAGLDVTVVAKEMVPRMNQDREMALFRVSQEALNNVLKHAKATKVQVTLDVDAESVSLTIIDNGRGYDAASRTVTSSKGLGLLIMQERLRSASGSLEIESRPKMGFDLIARAGRTQ